MYEELLATVTFFRDLSPRELTWLGDACRERDYAPGEHIQRQGNTSAVGLLIVLEGSVQLSRHDGGTVEDELGQFGVGAILGEQALLEDTPAPETITANEPTRLLALPIWDFRMTLRDFPDLAIHLIAILGQRLRQRET
jgi:CRP/FNR family transcriptional regulator